MHPGYDDDAMNTFLDRVQEHGGIRTRAEADSVTRATMATLAEAISSGQMHELGSGLPDGLRPDVDHSRGHARALGVRDFLERVSGEINTVDSDLVEARVRAVLRTVHEWAPTGEIDDTLAQLPPEFSALFSAPRE